MKKDIRYEELSKNIKLEIEKYFETEKKSNAGLSLEDAMFKWFDVIFESWISENYGGIKNKDKRKYYRLDIEIPVRIVDTLVESSEDEAGALDFIGTVINISRGGLYFKSEKFFELASIIKVEIDLSKIDSELGNVEALAMVIRAEKEGKDNYGIGLMFSSIYDEHKENLDIFIFRNVVHHIHLFDK